MSLQACTALCGASKVTCARIAWNLIQVNKLRPGCMRLAAHSLQNHGQVSSPSIIAGPSITAHNLLPCSCMSMLLALLISTACELLLEKLIE